MTDFTEHIALRARRLQAEGQYNDLFPGKLAHFVLLNYAFIPFTIPKQIICQMFAYRLVYCIW